MNALKDVVVKHRGIIAYLFFGVCTTLVNIATYYVCAHPLALTTIVSTCVAWLVAVAFAFFTNKAWVFDSPSWATKVVLREFCWFTVCRVATGVLDLGIMMLTVDICGWNDVAMKTISNVVVIILNYIASKTLIFRDRK